MKNKINLNKVIEKNVKKYRKENLVRSEIDELALKEPNRYLSIYTDKVLNDEGQVEEVVSGVGVPLAERLAIFKEKNPNGAILVEHLGFIDGAREAHGFMAKLYEDKRDPIPAVQEVASATEYFIGDEINDFSDFRHQDGTIQTKSIVSLFNASRSSAKSAALNTYGIHLSYELGEAITLDIIAALSELKAANEPKEVKPAVEIKEEKPKAKAKAKKKSTKDTIDEAQDKVAQLLSKNEKGD